MTQKIIQLQDCTLRVKEENKIQFNRYSIINSGDGI